MTKRIQNVNERFRKLNMKLLEPYQGYNVYHKVQCVGCSHTWRIIPRTALTKKTKCPECARVRRTLPTSEVVDKLNAKHISILGEYISSGHKTTLRCQTCNHTWVTTTTQLLHTKAGCPSCAGNVKYTQEDIASKIPSNIKMIGAYAGMNKTSTFVCSHGHTWDTLVSNVVHQHSNCPTCNPYPTNGGFGKRTVVDGVVFKSTLEAECYMLLKNTRLSVEYQKPYPHNTRMKCDFYIAGVWVEVSSFKHQQYIQRIEHKRQALQGTGERFTFVKSVEEFHTLLLELENFRHQYSVT